MSNEITENNQTTQVTPVPVTPAPQVETRVSSVEVKPVEAPTVDKTAQAFIKMRQEKRELKKQLAEAKAATVPPAAVAPATEPAPQVTIPTQTAPAPIKAEVDIEDLSAKAIEAMSLDADVKAVPGAILDIISIVDTDPRLQHLHDIDPMIAFREAKALWASKAGIGAPPPIPKSAPVSGGIQSGGTNLDALVEAAHNATPGSKEFFQLAQQVEAEMKRIRGF